MCHRNKSTNQKTILKRQFIATKIQELWENRIYKFTLVKILSYCFKYKDVRTYVSFICDF